MRRSWIQWYMTNYERMSKETQIVYLGEITQQIRQAGTWVYKKETQFDQLFMADKILLSKLWLTLYSLDYHNFWSGNWLFLIFAEFEICLSIFFLKKKIFLLNYFFMLITLYYLYPVSISTHLSPIDFMLSSDENLCYLQMNWGKYLESIAEAGCLTENTDQCLYRPSVSPYWESWNKI